MRSFKKVLAFAVVFAMVLSVMAPAFAASVPSDVIGTEYETAATRLAHFGIMTGDDKGSFAAEREITRAEMTKIVVAMKGMASAAELAKGPTVFEDVPADHWASGFINVASQAGLVKGRTATIFDPDAKVTYQEAITMIVRATGFVALPGAWPANYLNKAATLGITKGANVLGSSNGIRGVIAKLVNNALDAKAMKVKTYDANGVPTEYEESDDTVLEEYFDLHERTGIILATSREDIDLDAGRVTGILTEDAEDTTADETDVPFEYKAGDVDFSAYLGKEVSFYVDKDTKPYTVIGIKEVETSSDKIEEVEEFLDSDDDEKIVFLDEDGDLDEITVNDSDDITVVYNGRITDYTTGLLDLFYKEDEDGDRTNPADEVLDEIKAAPATGVIVEVDNDKYYLIIEQWSEPVLVTDVDDDDLVIEVTDNSGTNYDSSADILLDTEDNDDLYVKITKDDEEIEVEDIEENDVVVIKRSFGNNEEEVAVEIKVTSNTVSGEVESISKDGTEIDKIKVNGVRYVRNSDDTEITGIAVGDYVSLYLDENGEIEKVETTNEEGVDSNYAVVLKVVEQTFDTSVSNDEVDDVARVKLLLSDGTVKTYDAIENLRVYRDGSRSIALIHDGTLASGVTDYYDDEGEEVSDSDDIAEANVAGMIIEYETNSDGDLSKVTIPDYIDTIADGDFPIDYEEDDFEFGDYILEDETIIFNVWNGGSDTEVYTREDLGDNFITAASADVMIVPVDDGDEELEVLLVWGQELEASTADRKIAIVVNIDEEDDDVFTVTLNDGEEVFDLTTDEDDDEIIDLFDDGSISERDIIVYTANASGVFTDVEPLSSYSNKVNIFASIPAASRIVTDVDTSKGYITVGDETYEEIKKSVSKKPIVFDISDWEDSSIKSKDREVRAGDLGDVEEDDLIDAYKVNEIEDDTVYIVIIKERD